MQRIEFVVSDRIADVGSVIEIMRDEEEHIGTITATEDGSGIILRSHHLDGIQREGNGHTLVLELQGTP